MEKDINQIRVFGRPNALELPPLGIRDGLEQLPERTLKRLDRLQREATDVLPLLDPELLSAERLLLAESCRARDCENGDTPPQQWTEDLTDDNVRIVTRCTTCGRRRTTDAARGSEG